MTAHETAFDESGRPTPSTGFVPPSEPDEKGSSRHDRFKEAERISEWFWRRQEWIQTGRSARARKIRAEIVMCQIEGGTFSSIAKRLKVSRQAVHKHAKRLTRFCEAKRA
jgi:DNA-directed RNA polymerase specialized sigma24 family protein